MKLTKSKLKQLIMEELASTLSEAEYESSTRPPQSDRGSKEALSMLVYHILGRVGALEKDNKNIRKEMDLLKTTQGNPQ